MNLSQKVIDEMNAIPEMKVYFIEWGAFPKSERINILKTIPVGEYIYRLPYRLPKGHSPVWRVPIPTPLTFVIEEKVPTLLVFRCLVFEEVWARDEHGSLDVVWRRLEDEA